MNCVLGLLQLACSQRVLNSYLPIAEIYFFGYFKDVNPFRGLKFSQESLSLPEPDVYFVQGLMYDLGYLVQ